MDTYTGYHIDRLLDWLEKQKRADKALRVWSQSPIGSGSDHGTNPFDEFSMFAELWAYAEIKSFFEEEGGDSCHFTTEKKLFKVSVVDLPRDKWGNSATYHGGLDLQDGYYEVYYEDESYYEHQFPVELILNDEEEEFDEQDFLLGFVKTNYPHLVSWVGEETVCNGCTNSWCYATTNKPLDSEDWRAVYNAYRESFEAETN